MSGLFYTGVDNSGSLINTPTGTGVTDPHWNVTYVKEADGSFTTKTGAAYVVDVAAAGWLGNTSTAQWITAPNAVNANGANANQGNTYLPGVGTGNLVGTYVYTLKFSIGGSGTGSLVTNRISISLTIAADDNYAVFLNPNGYSATNGTSVPTSSPLAAGNSAWTNSTSFTLSNANVGTNFYVGDNYLVVVVQNTDSQKGDQTDNHLNASGLLFYQTSQTVVIDGTSYPINGGHTPVPEAGLLIPIVGVLGVFGLAKKRRCKGLSRRLAS